MNNLIEATRLLQYNKQDLVNELQRIGIAATMDMPLSKVAKLLQWAAGFGGCPIATIDSRTNEQVLFTEEEWNSMSSSQRGRYNAIGICLLAEGRRLIIAKEDCLSPTGTGTMLWSVEGYNIPNLKDYSDTLVTTGFYDDFAGKEKTDIILAAAALRQKSYPAAEQARAYKAYDGDPTEYFLGDVSEWTLLDRYRKEVNDALFAFFGVKLTNNNYWTSEEHTDGNRAWAVQASGALGIYYTKTTYYLCVRPFGRCSAAI